MAKKTKSKKKSSVIVATLQCIEDGKHRVHTFINKKNNPEPLELKKYNSTLRRVTLHREIKNKK